MEESEITEHPEKQEQEQDTESKKKKLKIFGDPIIECEF